VSFAHWRSGREAAVRAETAKKHKEAMDAVAEELAVSQATAEQRIMLAVTAGDKSRKEAGEKSQLLLEAQGQLADLQSQLLVTRRAAESATALAERSQEEARRILEQQQRDAKQQLEELLAGQKAAHDAEVAQLREERDALGLRMAEEIETVGAKYERQMAERDAAAREAHDATRLRLEEKLDEDARQYKALQQQMSEVKAKLEQAEPQAARVPELEAEIARLKAAGPAKAPRVFKMEEPNKAEADKEEAKKKAARAKGSVLGMIDIDEESDKSVAEQLKEALIKSAGKVLDLFREWDVDGDGQVTKKEFRKAMPMLGLDVPRKDIDELFDSWDPDKSGSISYEELKKLFTKAPAPKPAKGSPAAQRGPAKPQAATKS